MRRHARPRWTRIALLAALGTIRTLSSAAGPAEDDEALLVRLRSTLDEGREVRRELGRRCWGLVTAGNETRCAELEARWGELRRTALPAELLAGLEKELPATIETVAWIASTLGLEEAVPALRRAAARLEGEDREPVLGALCGLGDAATLEAIYGDEWRVLADRFLDEPPSRSGVFPRLVATCGGAALARRTERRARVVTDVAIAPEVSGRYVGDLELQGGETVTVLLDGREANGTEGQRLIFAHNEMAWIDARLLLEGEPPSAASLVARIAEAWRSGDHLALLEPIQLLASLHGADVEAAARPLGLPPGVPRVLSRLARVERRGSGEGLYEREIVKVSVEPILADAAAEIRLRVEGSYWEARSESVEILYGIDGSGSAPRRLAVRTLEDDLFSSAVHRFPYFVDLDDDDDLEVVVLEGTESYEGADTSGTWKVHLLDFDGQRFVHVPWTPRMREFLRRRLAETSDPFERTILRSHFGGRDGAQVQ